MAYKNDCPEDINIKLASVGASTLPFHDSLHNLINHLSSN